MGHTVQVAHQKQREAHLTAMKKMEGDGMVHTELQNEQLMRDAKQQGNQVWRAPRERDKRPPLRRMECVRVLSRILGAHARSMPSPVPSLPRPSPLSLTSAPRRAVVEQLTRLHGSRWRARSPTW